ncbi:hypothetical protein VTJ04DRAFT_3369 [Mycothermus thermophilus]|uniref:uncharacterized protein n=1 Tax=Humicola insolens TaxID=85995 RepID=UPI00374334A3
MRHWNLANADKAEGRQPHLAFSGGMHFSVYVAFCKASLTLHPYGTVKKKGGNQTPLLQKIEKPPILA